MVPLTVGEQGVLDREGVPAVLAQVSGERGPSRNEPINPERLEALGRSVLSAVDALDTAPDVTQARQNGIVLQRQQMPQWAVRLLVVMLILPVLATAIDGLARARRWQLRPGRWAAWTLSCAMPFAATALVDPPAGDVGAAGPGPRGPAAVRGAEIRRGRGSGPGAAGGLLRGVLVRLGRPHAPGGLGHAAGAGGRRARDGARGRGAGAGGVGDQPLHGAAAACRPCTCGWCWPLRSCGPAGRWGGSACSASRRCRWWWSRCSTVHQLGLGVGDAVWAAVLLFAGGFVGPGGGDPVERGLRLRGVLAAARPRPRRSQRPRADAGAKTPRTYNASRTEAPVMWPNRGNFAFRGLMTCGSSPTLVQQLITRANVWVCRGVLLGCATPWAFVERGC